MRRRAISRRQGAVGDAAEPPRTRTPSSPRSARRSRASRAPSRRNARRRRRRRRRARGGGDGGIRRRRSRGRRTSRVAGQGVQPEVPGGHHRSVGEGQRVPRRGRERAHAQGGHDALQGRALTRPTEFRPLFFPPRRPPGVNRRRNAYRRLTPSPARRTTPASQIGVKTTRGNPTFAGDAAASADDGAWTDEQTKFLADALAAASKSKTPRSRNGGRRSRRACRERTPSSATRGTRRRRNR